MVINNTFKSNKIEIVISNKQKCLLIRYQRGLETFFDNTDEMYWKCNKISLNRGGSYIFILIE